MRRSVLALLAAPLALVGALAVPAAALGHAKLLTSSPEANSAVLKPTTIKLTFSEAVVGALSGIELSMTGMPGMAGHQPIPISGFKTVSNGKELTAALPRALPSGSYELKWHAVTGDQHRAEGGYTFSVR